MSIEDIGIGMMIGMQYGSMQNSKNFAEAKAKLQRALEEADINALSQEAQKEAAIDCVGAVIIELGREASGAPFERRHSDPMANRARAEDFIDTAESHLHRLSSGNLSFSSDSVERIKKTNVELPKIVRKGSYLNPEAKPKFGGHRR